MPIYSPGDFLGTDRDSSAHKTDWDLTMKYRTKFGSLADYEKGKVIPIDDNPKNYVFSNIFEVANKSAPYERVAVAKNLEYVIEVARAEGVSSWYTAAHDEFVLDMDGTVEVELVKLDNPTEFAPAESQGARKLPADPAGRKMGRLVLSRGHQGLLPRGSAYRFKSDSQACLMIQTVEGPETVQKWAEICQNS